MRLWKRDGGVGDKLTFELQHIDFEKYSMLKADDKFNALTKTQR